MEEPQLCTSGILKMLDNSHAFFLPPFLSFRRSNDGTPGIIPQDGGGYIPTHIEIKKLISEILKFYEQVSVLEIWEHNAQKEYYRAENDYRQERETWDEFVAIFGHPPKRSPPEPPNPPKSPKPGYVYLMRSGDRYKIGTSKNVEARAKNLAQNTGLTVEVLHSVYCSDARKAELWWLDRLDGPSRRGEWFDLTQDQVLEFLNWEKEERPDGSI